MKTQSAQMSPKLKFHYEIMHLSTVETTSFATSKLDSPPLISIYYLPYENGEVQKIVLYPGNYSSFK